MEAATLIVLMLMLFGAVVVFVWLTQALAHYQSFKVGVIPTQEVVARDLAIKTTPPKLGWDWWAFFLGPIWFFAEGMWTQALILTMIAVLSGGVLLPFVMVYSALKSRETLEDRHIAKLSFY